MCGVKTARRGRNSSLITVLRISWYVCFQPFYFVSYYVHCIEYDDYFFFFFQETYNNRMRERYRDDILTHPEFDLDLWIEVGSSGGPDKNRVYGFSNTTADNLRTACSVSTVGSSQSISSSQSKESVALQKLTEKYDNLQAKYAQLKASHAQQRAEQRAESEQIKKRSMKRLMTSKKRLMNNFTK